MWNMLIPIVTLIVALLVAVLGVTLPPTSLHFIIFVSRFFEIMIPILVVGALIKFLFSCPAKKD